MNERKDSDLVFPGEQMMRKLRALSCDLSESQVALVSIKAGISDAATRNAATGKHLYRREWQKLAAELGVEHEDT